MEGEDGGIVGIVKNVITAGIGWLTTGRKRRGGLLRAMQGAPHAMADPMAKGGCTKSQT
jgi:hypothetical protein